MVIFRSSRGAKKHDKVKKGQEVRIYGSGPDALGEALADTVIQPFSEVRDLDIRLGYFGPARNRDALLKCLKEMYPKTGYERDTLTAMIRVRRTK